MHQLQHPAAVAAVASDMMILMKRHHGNFHLLTSHMSPHTRLIT